MLVKNDSLIFGGFQPGANRIRPVLDYPDNELRFRYAAASFEDPKSNEYQVWLEGFDYGWSNWTSEAHKDYTNIPEGSYTFHVRGRNIYDTIGEEDSFSFEVLPPWYRTVWAYLGYILLAGGAIYSGYRIRINRILKEQRIRNRIASDLHDEVSATLSSISYFAQAIRQTGGDGSAKRFVNLISESASDAKEKITDIIWSIDPENDDWINLLSKARRYASDMFESKGIGYELDIDTDIHKPLNLELRQHLWLIFKEMITNVARHSNAGMVVVRFGIEQGDILLSVMDDGDGFDTTRKFEGKGVRSIRTRAGKIDGKLELFSEPGKGSRWELRIRN